MKKIILPAILAMAFGNSSFAEVQEVTIDIQNGSNYMDVAKMKDFWDDVAKAHGLNTTLTINVVGSPGVVADRLISGASQAGAMSYPGLLKLNEKTDGDMKILFGDGIVNILLNTNNPEIKSIADFKPGHKIAVTSLGISIQAIANRYVADKDLGDWKKLDPLTVAMPHPDAYAAFTAGKIDAHWATPPFSSMETEQTGVRTLAASKDLWGRHHLTVVVVSEKFCKDNPKVCDALFETHQKAVDWIKSQPRQAAEFFQKNIKAKETVDDYYKQLVDKQVEFEIAPQGLEKFAAFLYKIGEIKNPLKSWKDVSMPQLQQLGGN
ncbi:MAG: ABC transporter substrate-binding protein [Candidatus Competibacteraceae bacterium]